MDMGRLADDVDKLAPVQTLIRSLGSHLSPDLFGSK